MLLAATGMGASEAISRRFKEVTKTREVRAYHIELYHNNVINKSSKVRQMIDKQQSDGNWNRMDAHSGYYIQYSIEDVVFGDKHVLFSTINLILQEHKYSNILT